MRFWVQSLMDACLNVSCINVIYKHIHHGGYANMYIMFKWCQNNFVGNVFKGNVFSWKIIWTMHI